MNLYIIGTGDHAQSVCDAALSSGWNVIAFLGKSPEGGVNKFNVPIIDTNDLPNDGAQFIVAIGDNNKRRKVTEHMNADHRLCQPIVHKTAYVSPSARIARGTVVLANANVGPCTAVWRGCIVNTGASLDHHGEMLDGSSLAPGVVCGGRVRIGVRTAIGIGAVIKHGVVIADDVVIGANSYVHRSIMDARVVAYGSPAKVIRTRIVGEAYLS